MISGKKFKTKRFRTKIFALHVVSGSSHVIVNINGHWRFTWSLFLGPVRISRYTHKLTRTFYVNNKNKKLKLISVLQTKKKKVKIVAIGLQCIS